MATSTWRASHWRANSNINPKMSSCRVFMWTSVFTNAMITPSLQDHVMFQNPSAAKTVSDSLQSYREIVFSRKIYGSGGSNRISFLSESQVSKSLGYLTVSRCGLWATNPRTQQMGNRHSNFKRVKRSGHSTWKSVMFSWRVHDEISLIYLSCWKQWFRGTSPFDTRQFFVPGCGLQQKTKQEFLGGAEGTRYPPVHWKGHTVGLGHLRKQIETDWNIWKHVFCSDNPCTVCIVRTSREQFNHILFCHCED